MDDRRSSTRWRTSDYAKNRKKYAGKFFGVYDHTSDEFIGHLADISSEGMMILSKNNLPEGTTLKLRIELPEEIKGSDRLMVEAKTVWSETDTKTEYNRIGFSFILTFPHHAEVLTLLFGDENDAKEEKSEQETSTIS